MFNPKITIAIPVYNGSNFIKKAIESAINQNYENIEILVINDGSEDDGKTEQAIVEYKDKVKYIKKDNGGVASALNCAIENMTGEYLSWLSHDDVYKPNKISEQVEILKNLNDKNTIIFSNVELIDEDGKIFFTTDYGKDIEKEKLCQGIYPVIKGIVNGCSTLIARQCFSEVGMFNENLKTTNDYEMWERLFSKFNSYFIEKPLIQYRVHKNQDTNKSPYFIEESNALWINIINNLQENQIKDWGFEPFNVYMDLYFQMYNSGYNEAFPVAYCKAKKAYEDTEPAVSVIMPCRNSEKYLNKAIDSVLNQSYRNFELIIVNDNSTDHTEEIIKEYVKKDFRIKYLKNNNRPGISGAMNTGISISKGKYFTRMDSDDIIRQDKIKRQFEFLEKNIEFGICSVNIAMMDKMGNIYSENIYPDQITPSEWTFLWTNPIPNAPCMYRKKVLEENSIEFSDLKTAEDYDYLRKLMTKTKVYMINEPMYYYRNNEKSMFNKNKKETLNNSLKISKKYFEEIVNENIPEYYKFLTFFYTEDDEPVYEDIDKVYEFLLSVADKFRIYFNWDEIEWANTKKDIFRIIERYSVYKYLSCVHGKIGADYGCKIEKKQAGLVRITKKGIKYIKKNGIKKTLIKIKDKIWKRK